MDCQDFSCHIRLIDLRYILGSIPSCPAEEIFLCRLLQRGSIEANGNDEIIRYVEDALALRHSSTRELLKILQDSIDDQRVRTESIACALHGKLSSEGQKKS